MIINEAGNYTLKYTATDECGNSSVVERELEVTQPPIYGAIWDGSSSPQWTRTDGATLFADPVPQHSDGNGGWVGGSSPFDNIMPWSGMEVVEDADAGTLVKIPKFWYKWTRDGASMKLQISNEPQEGFFTSPAHADRGDGVGERDVVYVGRYLSADNGLKSLGNEFPSSHRTISSNRSGIHNLGNDIWQYDFAMHWTICMLYLVEFADWNSQRKIGFGGAINSDTHNTGYTDAMTYHTGTTATSTEYGTISANTIGEVQYRHIEGLWSNARFFCDGIYFDDRSVYVIKNPANFGDYSVGVLVGERANVANRLIAAYTTPPSGYEYAMYPSDISYDGFDTYVCDGASYSSTGKILMVGGSTNTFNEGLFSCYGAFQDNVAGFGRSSRLMKLPSA